ncbi:MAG: efflux RND transporter permease subunit [Candidatus Sericytochromatia bacterium]|nr:efflux RND transporter permease subunit [Candidatus Sericytochromatia bacterium]
MNISAWAIRKPVPIILFFLVLLIIGGVSFKHLGINDNPNVDFPIITIGIAQPGAAPSELETEVTRKVEDAVVGLENLQHVRSVVTDSSSTTILEFKVGADSDRVLNDARDAISRIRQTLPADILEPSIIHPNFSGEPFLIYSVASKTRPAAEVSRIIDDDITRRLLTVPGVSQIRRSGGLDREIRIELDPTRMMALGITTDQVNSLIRQFNINLPGGKAELGGAEQSIRTLGTAVSVSQLKNLPVPIAGGRFVNLDTLGTITDTTAEPRQSAWLAGKPVVAFAVVRAQGAALVGTEEAARAEVEKLKKTLPADLEVELIRTTGDFNRNSYSASIDALYLGAGLAVVVIYLFLRNWQATVISALAIPLSVVGTFWIMSILGYTLNFMTLLGLSLVVGVLVDDAIVDLENIYRHIAMGKTPMQAAFEATDEIGLAVVATTLTIVAVFIPVAFMGGIPGQFFRSFGLTVSVSVLFSLLVARTLTPMMGAYLLPSVVHENEDKETWFNRSYARLLSWCLVHRWKTIVSAVVIFIGSMMLVPLLPKGFFDAGDVNETTISATLPTGATLQDTERVILEVTRRLSSRPEVKKIFATIGAGSQNGVATEGGAVNAGKINVVLVDAKKRKLSQSEFELATQAELDQIPGARLAYLHYGAGGGQGKPVNVILKGNDARALDLAADTLLTQMRGLKGIKDSMSSAAELRPEVRIIPDPARAGDQGVSVMAIARVARMATQGDTDRNLAKFNADDRQVNIRVQLNQAVRRDIGGLSSLLVPGKQGLVPLGTVADIQMGSGPVQIDRYDRARQITLSANLDGVSLGEATAGVAKLPLMKSLPAGVTYDSDGEAKVMADVFGAVILALGAGVLFISAVLVLLFGNFLHSLTIMVALPLSIGGAFIGLLVTGMELGLMSLIGIIMLMGLVTKNSILLVEYALVAMHNGTERREALMKSGAARLRPILMTTVAMIAGMVPIAMGLGVGTKPRAPMAVAVIGGLLTSTAFTLVVIPAVFTLLDDLQLWLMRHMKRIYRGKGDTLAPVSEGSGSHGI